MYLQSVTDCRILAKFGASSWVLVHWRSCWLSNFTREDKMQCEHLHKPTNTIKKGVKLWMFRGVFHIRTLVKALLRNHARTIPTRRFCKLPCRPCHVGHVGQVLDEQNAGDRSKTGTCSETVEWLKCWVRGCLEVPKRCRMSDMPMIFAYCNMAMVLWNIWSHGFAWLVIAYHYYITAVGSAVSIALG